MTGIPSTKSPFIRLIVPSLPSLPTERCTSARTRSSRMSSAKRLGVIRPLVEAMLDTLKDVPVDIEPRYVTAQQLEASTH